MGRIRNRLLQFASRYSKGKPFTEATATTALSRWLYRGHGEKYLSLPVSEDGIGRPANAGPRHFRCPSKRQHYARWFPFREHLFGDQKGVVSDTETTSLPFVTVDIDRHNGAVKKLDHQHVVIEAGRFLCNSVPHVKWLVEVNPKNGSAKSFGYRRTGDHFTKSESQRLASRIRRELIQRSLCHNNNVEVFGDNCAAVWLPLRRDKITIVEGGMLPRCTRKTRDWQFYPQHVFEPIRCYSALHFMAWIHAGENYDDGTLISALRFACAGMPDEVASNAGRIGKAPSLRRGSLLTPHRSRRSNAQPSSMLKNRMPSNETGRSYFHSLVNSIARTAACHQPTMHCTF